MTEKRTIFDRMLGLEEKRVWKIYESRAKALGEGYYNDYKMMQKYLWISGLSKWEEIQFAFEQLLDLLEEVAVDGRKVTDVTGPDVASFLDELTDSKDWHDQQRDKLNKSVK